MRQLQKQTLIWRARRKIVRLDRASDAVSKSLANALREALAGNVTPAEQVWIEKIESLRRELNSSSKELSITDYGARSSKVALSEEEMYRGQIVTRTVGTVCRRASLPFFWTWLLFRLIREFRPAVCLELGTCLGISAAYQAAALKLNRAGKLVTMEGAESLASLARQNFQQLGFDNVSVVTGRFQDTLEYTLKQTGTIDYAFIDGHHDEKATLAYFEKIYPFLSEEAVLVFDDVSWSPGMKRAWNTIVADNRIGVAVNLKKLGICIVDRGSKVS